MFRLLLTALILVLLGCTSVGEPRTLGRYDFSYRIEGDPRAAPLQVFDDGKQTYLQFRDIVPGIFAIDSEGRPVVLPTRRDGQYVIADRIDREFVFLVEQDKGRAAARYVGKQNRAVLPHELPAPSEPEPPPQVEPLSEKIPFPKAGRRLSADGRRALERLLPAAQAATRIAILDRPARQPRDRGVGHARALAVRDWLVGRGLDAEGILIVKGSAVAPDYCEVLFSPPGTTKILDTATAPTVEQAGPVTYGPAIPIKVSLPAQPVFVDRGRAGGMEVSGRVR